jgi:hypothetical protein
MLLGRTCSVERFVDQSVLGLEIWDAEVEGGRLQDFRHSPEFPLVFLQVVEQLLAGTAVTRSRAKLPVDCLKQIKSIYIGGSGDVDVIIPAFAAVFKQAPVPVVIGSAGRFAGEIGGNGILLKRGGAGVVIYVGQTAIKVSVAGRRFIVERDFASLPLAQDLAESDVAAERYTRRFQRFLADAMGAANSMVEQPIDHAVIALASALDSSGTLLDSSYAGTVGVPNLIKEALQSCRFWNGETIVLLTDAELAAVSARAEPASIELPAPTLVLTVGHRVGAAILLAENKGGRDAFVPASELQSVAGWSAA